EREIELALLYEEVLHENGQARDALGSRQPIRTSAEMIFFRDDGNGRCPPAPVEQGVALDLSVGPGQDFTGGRRLRLDLSDDARSGLPQRSHEGRAVAGPAGGLPARVLAARQASTLVLDDFLEDPAHAAAARSFICWKLACAAPESTAV